MPKTEKQMTYANAMVHRGQYAWAWLGHDERLALFALVRDPRCDGEEFQILVDDIKAVCELDHREGMFDKEKAERKERIMKTLHKYGQAQDR